MTGLPLPRTIVLETVEVDDARSVKAYTYDPNLPDVRGKPWASFPLRCSRCGYLWWGVWRADTRVPACPRCVPSDRPRKELLP